MSGRLRIIAGEFGGRMISCPETAARPTTDRVREAVMSSVHSRLGGFEGLSVCDAFAGSGACGLEALSRGAARVALFDKDPAAFRAVKGNVELLRVGAQAAAEQRDVLARGIAGPFAPYDLIFLDPPYATAAEEVAEMLAAARTSGAVPQGALVVYEHEAASPALSCLDEVKSRRYGKTVVDMGVLA